MTQRIALPDDRIAINGAVELDKTDAGVMPRRLSSAWRFQFPMEVDVLASSPSGVRLGMSTTSTTLGVELLATHFKLGDLTAFTTSLDVVVNNEVVAAYPITEGHCITVDAETGAFGFEFGEPMTVTFDVPTDGPFEVWLPSNSQVELRAVHIDDDASISAPPSDARRKWTHHGSSISHCLEAKGGSQTWPATAARLADVNITNLGLAGQCHLDQFTARTIRDHPADLLSLKVGINVVNGDTLRQRTFAPALHGFLDTIREGHPHTPFLIVSPIWCPAHEDHAGPTDGRSGTAKALGTETTEAQGALTLKQIRTIITDVVKARRKAGDTNLHYLDGLALFNEADEADLPDGLHPNGDGYIRMGERFAASVFGDGGVFAS